MKRKMIRTTIQSGLGAALLAASLAGGSAVAATPDDYLYRPDLVDSVAEVSWVNFNNRVSYMTEGGFARTVKVSVRVPPHLSQSPLPVVIVVHGGGAQPNGRPVNTTLPQWGETIARAGYVAINIMHGTNEGTDAQDLCNAIGWPVPGNPAALGATLEDLVATLVAAGASGTPVSVDLEAIIAAHPGLFEQLRSLDGEPDESELAKALIDRIVEQLQTCGSINGLGLWDRPMDVAAVVNALHDGLFPELAGWMDLTKVALLGHSNGTASTLGTVGLVRALPNGVKVPVPFPAGSLRRPNAVVALSPMGINTYGHFDTDVWSPGVLDSKEHSWMGLEDIPVMTMTGDGDNHCKTRFVCRDSDSGSKRRIPFERMPEGDKYLMYVSDRFSPEEIVSSHEMFGDLDKPGVCRSPALADECASTVRWIKSSAIAFLDAYLKGDGRARNWLKGKKLAKASAGIAAIERK